MGDSFKQLREVQIKEKKISFIRNPHPILDLYFIAYGSKSGRKIFLNDCQRFKLKMSNFFSFPESLIPINIHSVFLMDLDIKDIIDIKIIPSEEKPFFDESKLLLFLKTVKSPSPKKDLFSILNDYVTSFSDKLLIILFPEEELGNEIEYEQFRQGNNSLNFLLVSTGRLWEQVVFRFILRIIGLGDEFEKDGESYKSPNKFDGERINNQFHNIIYAENKDHIIRNSKFKWTPFLPPHFFSDSAKINSFSGHPELADTRLSGNNFQPEKIQFYEGGGGYRTKVYRSAQDCLMRRQIGNSSLPIRQSKVPLCIICEAYVKSRLLEAAKYNSKDSTEFRQSTIQLNT